MVEGELHVRTALCLTGFEVHYFSSFPSQLLAFPTHSEIAVAFFLL